MTTGAVWLDCVSRTGQIPERDGLTIDRTGLTDVV